jgi:polyhydroxyalkanoate synthesis regulator phasin
MAEERSRGLGEGIRTGIGILTAFKEAIEETLDEAVARGEFSPERAKTVMKGAADRVQSSIEEARERLDLVSRRELDALRSDVAELRRRIEVLEDRLGGGSGGADDPIMPSGDDIPVD